MHFYGAQESYAKAPEAVYDTCVATPKDYAREARRLGLTRFVAVQSVTYGFDNRCLLDGMTQTGISARGVAVIAPDTQEEELEEMHALGVRGVRAFMFNGGAYQWSDLPKLAKRIAPLGWHLQMQFNGRDLPRRATILSSLECPVVLDHLAKFLPPVAPDDPAFLTLLSLLESGRFWVKISSPYESSQTGAPDYHDVRVLAQALVQHAPDRMLWGTNWPHTAQDNPPDNLDLVRLLGAWVPSRSTRERILCVNPEALYDF